MNRFSITFNLEKAPVCPSCICELDDRNIMFWAEIAFCQGCRAALDEDRLRTLAQFVCCIVQPRYQSVSRNLVLFCPNDEQIRGLKALIDGPLREMLADIAKND